MDFQSFARGDDRWRPVPFWSLNHRLEPEEMSRQVGEMARAGCAGFFLHARSGLLTPYFSRAWMDAIGHAIREAKRHGLKAWLYDEDPYPSGAAGGRLAADHPEYRARTMHVVKTAVRGPARTCLDVPSAAAAAVIGVETRDGTLARVVDLGPEVGVLRTAWREERYSYSFQRDTTFEVFPHRRADTWGPLLRLEWEAPAGDWQVLAFYLRDVADSWVWGTHPDVLDPEAVSAFINSTYEPYRERFGEYFGNVIPGIFADEPHYICGRYPWTRSLASRLDAAVRGGFHGCLAALEVDFAGSAGLRVAFWQAVADLLEASYFKQIRAWCERNGLLFVGHANSPGSPLDALRSTGNYQRMEKSFHVPGTDHCMEVVGDTRHPQSNFGPKATSSVAHIQGSGRVLCETFAVTEWNLKLSDAVKFSNWLYALGIDTIVPHVLAYSIDGPRKRDAGPSLFYQNPWWKHFRLYSDYLARLGSMLGGARTLARAALINPSTSFMADEPVHHDRARYLLDCLTWMMDGLFRHHVQFDLVDELELDRARAGDGSIQVGACRFETLILPPVMYLRDELARTLHELAKAGGKVVRVEAEASVRADVPGAMCRIDGNVDAGFASAGFAEVLQDLEAREGIRVVGEGAEEVLAYRCARDRAELVFLVNRSAAERTVTVSRADGRDMEEWNPSTIAASPRGEAGTIEVRLLPWAGTFVVTSPGKDRPAPRRRTEERRLLGPVWEMRPRARNVLLLDRWRVHAARIHDPLDLRAFDVTIPYVAPGSARSLGLTVPDRLTWLTSFVVEGRPANTALLAEAAAIRGSHEIRINGILLPQPSPARVYDCMNIRYEIPEEVFAAAQRRFYQRGVWIVSLAIDATDLEDGLREPLHLIGDFESALVKGQSAGARIAPCAEKKVGIGSWTQQGFPYFAGSISYAQDMELEHVEEDRSYRLSIECGGDCAEVTVNGTFCGARCWPPWEVEIGARLRPGRNRIEISVTNTMENMLVGAGNPAGLLGPVVLIVS